MLSADFKSAFAVMNWSFLEKCLKKIHFWEMFIDMFWCLHKSTFSRVIYNGHLSEQFINLKRGCRQGDPASCYFLLLGQTS